MKVTEFSGWHRLTIAEMDIGARSTVEQSVACLKETNLMPKNFSWLEPSKLAGCARPESEAELKGVKEQGIRTIISLTGTPLIPDVVQRLGFDYLHSHMSSSPTTRQLGELVEFIDHEIRQSKPVLVHCGEGKGRTGTVLAAYLVKHGLSADEAIQFVREKRPGSIQTVEQEKALEELEKIRDS